MPGTTLIGITVFIILLCGLSHWDCVAAEQTCQANSWPAHRPGADVRFALLLSKNFINFDEDPSQNCEITSDALQHFLAVEWLVEKFNQANNGSGYIPGISIGFDVLNDCSIPEYAARNSVSFSSKYLPYTTSQCTPQETNSTHAGFIMVGKSTVAQKVAAISKDLPVPIISATATLPELSDRQVYPNFFRTVPSDDHQMTLVADILQKLSWTYIVVAYQDDLYGNSNLNILKQKALERNICIHKSLKVSGSSLEIAREFDQIVDTAKDTMIAVVVIGDIHQNQGLLCILEQSPPKKFHFIMTEAINRYVFTQCLHNSWTFTISTDADVEMNDLRTYINTRYQSEGLNGEKHPIIEEYLQLDIAPKAGGLVDGDDTLAPFMTSTINAVFAMLEAVRALHKEACGDQAGRCEAMESKLNENRLLELLMSNEVDYSQMNPEVSPDGLRSANVSFTFNPDSGDILPLRNLNEYLVYFIADQQYKSIGTFSKGQLQFNVAQVENLAHERIPTSVCAGRCDTCLHNNKVPIVFLEGDVYIVGVLSIHEADLFDCGAFRKTGNDAFVAEGFIYAIKLLRKKTKINFGAIGIDDCYSPLRITSLLSDYMSNINPSNNELFRSHVPREKIIGAIGCRSSGCTIATASIFMPQKIPLISYAASSPDLDDRVNYPYFLRTVPSDMYQAQVMVDIIKQMGWEYVGLLYVKNNYGSKGMLAFRDIVDQEGSGICVPPEFGISEENDETMDNDAFFNAYMHFRTLQVKVVVFFGIDERFRSFIEIMEKNNRHGDFIFLASEEWGNNKIILTAGVKSARGSITLKLQDVSVEYEDSFRQYLSTKQPSSDDLNIWYGEFVQNLFGCNFKGGLINEFERECNSSLKLSNEQINELVKEQRLTHIMNAVFAMGNGFKSVKDNKCEGKFPCEYLTQNPEGTVEEIRKQKIYMGQQSRNVFDEHHNGAIGFEVFNIQSTDGGRSYEYAKVGTFFGSESNELDLNEFKFYDDAGNTISIKAKCSGTLCDQCKYKSSPTPPVTPKPKTEEQSSTDYKDSEILIISLIIILFIAIAVTVATLFLCFRRKCKDIEKKFASNDEQIYAEPDHQVYPGPYNTAMPIFSDPNFSPYQDSAYRTASNQSGVGLNNSAYSPESEHVDSVSQVIALRRQYQSDANINGHGNSDDSESTTHRNPNDQRQIFAAVPVPHYTGRPMPSTAIARSNTYVDGDGALLWSGNASSVSQPYALRGAKSDLSHNANRNVRPSIDTRDPNSSGLIMTVPYSSAPATISANTPTSDPIIYYIRDSNGQLTALAQPNPIPRTSVKSDGSSSVVAEYGPYSDALAQKKTNLKSQMPPAVSQSPYLPQQIIAVPVNTVIPPNIGTQYEFVELQDMGVPLSTPRPHRGTFKQGQTLTEIPLTNNSPIHYASPIHAPAAGNIGEPVIMHQPVNTLLYQDQAAGLPVTDSNVSAANHFRQFSDPHRQPEWPVSQEDQTAPSDKFPINTAGTVSTSDLEREEANRYLGQSTRVPDVVSGGPLPPATGFSRTPNDLEKVSEGTDKNNTDIRFHQPLEGQFPLSEANSPFTNV